MHRIGKARRRSLALAVAALAASAVAAPAAQAGDVTLKIVNARDAVGFVKGAEIAPGTPYKAIINVDDSGDPSNAVDPRCGFAPGVALDYAQYPESCPWPSLSGMNPGMGPVQNLVWHGDQDGLNTTTAVTLPAGKYLISALVDGYRLDGVHVVVPATGSVQAVLEAQPEPLPLATVRMDVFEDNAPSNGQFDLEPESGLAGFTGHIAEVAGEVTTDYFGNPLCTNYVDSTPGDGVPDLVDGVPTIDPQNPGGTCLSDAEGHIVIPFLGPGRYAGSAEPPADQAADWIQTSTLEGRHDWDSWVQEGATGFDVEMVNGVESQAFVPLGFVRVNRGPALSQAELDAGATGRVSASPQAVGSVTGTVVSALSYTPDPDYGITIGDDGEQYGQVQDGTVPNAWIAIGDIGNGDQTVYVGQADGQGRFDIRGLRPGEYNITFWDEEQVHILHMEQLTIPDATPVEMDTIMLAQWFGQVEGFVFNDDNENGHRDPGETGVAGQAVVLRSRDNSERDGGDVTAITDVFGHYELRAAYPLVQWVVMEAYSDRYRATGYTYRTFNESTEHVIDEPGVVDIGATHIIGQKSFVDWGFKAYQPGENGGIVGTVSYGTTRNELDPAELAIEPWQVGLAGATVTLYEAVQQPDGSWQKGAQLDQTTTELWHRPTGCDPRDAWGDPVLYPFNSVTEPNGTEHECVEGLGGGQQVENLKGKGNATVNGNYGFEAAPGDYIVEVTMPDDLSGAPAFKPTREEDINVFAGTALTPQVQRIECAGPLHTVDVAGVGADGPDATVNPTFAGEGGSPYEGQQKPLCSAKLVHVDDQRSVAPSFEFFTDVPIPGRMWGLIIDDLTMSTDKREILFGDKLGLANVPVGFYDYTGKPYEITQTDRNGYYEVLLPSTTNINCPTPSGVCPNVVRVVGNDPGSAEHPNPGFDPTHKVMSANWQISPGQYAQSDLAPFSNVAQVIAPGAQLAHAAKCELDAGIPQLFAVNDVVFNTNQGGQQLVIKGRGFGAGGSAPATPVTARVELQGPSGGPTSISWDAPGTTWTDTQITVTLPTVPNTLPGPRNLRIVRADGRGSINGITVHYIAPGNGGSYVRPSRVFRVGPGRPYATIQAAINAAAGYTGVPDGAVEDGWDGQLERAIVAVYPGTPGQWNPQGSYRENVIVPGALKLQGVGPGGFRADGSFVQGTDIDASTWSAAEDETWWGLMQDFAPVAASPVADGAVITVVGRQGAFNSTSFRGQIDGIHIRGGESLGLPNTINPLGGGPAPNPQGVQGALSQGGGIFLLGGQRNFQVTNNVIQGNGGAYGGAIRLGAPNVGTNDLGNVDILDNQILHNGGTTKAGAIAVFNGADDYEIRRNEICGNFSAEYGGGISVYGRSPNGQIAQNRIYFNASYDEGAGIFVGGELPNDPDLPSDGTGAQTITGNIVQANISNDDGAGIRLLMVMNSRINVTNNMLVNNVATHEGAGIALDDAPDVLFAGNTVMKNITTATAMTSDGRPAPTGLSMTANSEQLQAAAGIGPFTPPRIVNSVFWDNRAGSWDGVGDAVVRGIGLAGDPTPIEHWDVGMADASYGTMPVTNSVLQSTNGVTASPTNVIQDPLVESPFDTTIFTAPFRGDPHFVGTTIVALDVPPVRAGDYHLTSASPAIGRAAVTAGQPTTDIDGQGRTTPWDIGADEYVAPPAPRFRAAQVGSTLAVTASLGSTVQTHPTKRPPAGAAPVTYRSRCTTCTAKLAVRRGAGHRIRLIAMKRAHGRFSADVKGLRPGTYRVRVVVRYPGGVRAVSSWKTITVARRRAR